MDTATVVDANVAVRAILDEEERAIHALNEWAREGRRLIAPDHWLPEAISAVRRAVWAGIESAESSATLLDDLFGLPVTTIPTDRALADSALRWAARIGQAKAYDSLYLAVAERFRAPFVTLDERLLDRCRQLGLDFVEGLPDVAG